MMISYPFYKHLGARAVISPPWLELSWAQNASHIDVGAAEGPESSAQQLMLGGAGDLQQGNVDVGSRSQ